MLRGVRKRRIGFVAAMIAAYALVFNVVLTSVLTASLSPAFADALHELCVSGGNADVGKTDADKSDADKGGRKTAIHCPMCVGHHVDGGLPPRSPTLVDRIPLRANAVFSFQRRIFARALSFDHLSRGPPGLI